MILKDIKYLITQNSEREIEENLDVRIKGSEIAEIGKNLDGAETVDCSDKVVLPGLVNCHTHVSMTILRGIEDDKPIDRWLEEDVLPAEHKIGPGEVEKGAEMGIREMLKSGTTCFNDMYAPEGKVASAVRKYGIRASLGEGMIDEGQDTEKEINSSREFIASHIDEELIEPVVNPHSVYTCSDEVFEKSLEQSQEFDVPVHIHVSETTKENKEFMEEAGKTPIEYLEEKGILERKVLAAHCTHLKEKDLNLMQEHDVGVAHCPTANAKLGSGIAAIPAMLDRDIKVGLGTDGPASNNSLNMFQEMKTAALMQKVDDPEKMKSQEILDMATFQGAQVLGINKVGRLKEGWKADIIAVEIDESLRPLRKDSLVSHLVFSNPRVAHTVVDGEVLMEEGNIALDIDTDEFERMSRDLW